MTYNYEKAFTEGHKYNNIVAKFLSEQGIPCKVPELELAQNKADRARFTLGEKDIILEKLPKVLEVKTTRRAFTDDSHDFPFSNTIVDTVHGYESKEVKPYAYILYSQPTGSMLVLPPSTKNNWNIKTIYDTYQDLTDDFYLINKKDIRPMADLVARLLQLQNATH
jgi:hypothetical protein